MSKIDFTIGSSTLEGFYGWINERHRIWHRRKSSPKPWTDDEIFLDYKFTNAFRELDIGTLALREMLKDACKQLQRLYDTDHIETIFEEELILFNVIWYRLFNLEEHARELGFVTEFEQLETYIRQREKDGKRIFTSAHMTTGIAGQLKSETYIGACKEVWDERNDLASWLMPDRTMESMFLKILPLWMVGPFVAYEIICDLRFTPLMSDAPDKMTWANVGPGAKRGLQRLGLTPETIVMGHIDGRPRIKRHSSKQYQRTWLDHMVWLLDPRQAYKYLEPHVKIHCRDWCLEEDCVRNPILLDKPVEQVWPPFELREIEHSLCEFDKYERVRLGQGRPRSKYDGRKEK